MLHGWRCGRVRVPVHVECATEQRRPRLDPAYLGDHDMRYHRSCIPRDPPTCARVETASGTEAAAVHRASDAVLQEPAVLELRT